jgi:hypothetical protein
MGSTGRTSLARILLLTMVLSVLPVGARAVAPAAARAAVAGVVDNRRTPPPGSATLPVRGPIPGGVGSGTPVRAGSGTTGGADAFVPGRVLVGFEAGGGGGAPAGGRGGGRRSDGGRR